ncbi:hypothetical protein C8Q73DRAFT_40784, partial [Cubamyces lactineus]
ARRVNPKPPSSTPPVGPLRLLAVAETDVEARRVTVEVVVVDTSVLRPVALVDDLLESVPALLLRRELAIEGNVGPTPADRGAVRPVVAATEGLASGVHARFALALLAAGLTVAGGGERGGREGRDGGGESREGGKLELHDETYCHVTLKLVSFGDRLRRGRLVVWLELGVVFSLLYHSSTLAQPSVLVISNIIDRSRPVRSSPYCATHVQFLQGRSMITHADPRSRGL